MGGSANWSVLIGSATALAGVILGAVMTPLLSHFLEERRAKSKFKPELIELIYQFFSYRKSNFLELNESGWLTRFLFFKKHELIALSTDIPKANDLEIEVELLLKRIQQGEERYNDVYETLVSIESKLMSMTALSFDYHGKSVYTKLDNIIRSMINDSNQAKLLYDYQSLSVDQVNDLRDKKHQQFRNYSMSMDDECSRVINKVLAIL